MVGPVPDGSINIHNGSSPEEPGRAKINGISVQQLWLQHCACQSELQHPGEGLPYKKGGDTRREISNESLKCGLSRILPLKGTNQKH